nr:hypothetical protein CFP56_01985 [Quercus suber]
MIGLEGRHHKFCHHRKPSVDHYQTTRISTDLVLIKGYGDRRTKQSHIRHPDRRNWHGYFGLNAIPSWFGIHSITKSPLR